MKKSNKKILIAILVLLAGVGFLISRSLTETSVYYMTVDELKSSTLGKQLKSDQMVRVGGQVVEGSVEYNQRDLILRFTIRDEKKPEATIDALYNGAMPDSFEPDIEALLEGTFDRENNLFRAKTLMVKCPSKYESEQDK